MQRRHSGLCLETSDIYGLDRPNLDPADFVALDPKIFQSLLSVSISSLLVVDARASRAVSV